MSMVPEQLALLVIAANEAVSAACEAVADIEDSREADTAQACLRSAQAALSALSIGVESILPPSPDESPQRLATDDPATCGHPLSWDLPGGIRMCESCGAQSKNNGPWVA